MIKKMKQFFKNIFYLLLILTSLSACQNVKDGLTGQKKSSSDEFLVEKKNPLVLPPDSDKLPEPTSVIESSQNDEEEIDLKSILTKKNSTKNTKSTNEVTSGSLEKSILEKIKSN
mgnify:FL=1